MPRAVWRTWAAKGRMDGDAKESEVSQWEVSTRTFEVELEHLQTVALRTHQAGPLGADAATSIP